MDASSTTLLTPELAAMIARFGTGISQHARLLTLTHTHTDEARPDNFVVERITGAEAVNTLFRFDIYVLSVNTQLELAPLVGEPFTLRLLQADNTYRAWHGYCTESRWQGTDGGVARYQLRLEPFLAFLRMRFDSYIFQSKHTLDIVTELLADYPQARFRFEVSRPLPVRDICTQYRESDLEFLTRILARDGLSYRFEHAQSGTDADTNSTAAPQTDHTLQADHTLVIFDHLAVVPALTGGQTLRFAGVRAADSEDAIDHFAAANQVVPQRVATSSWLPHAVIAPSAEAGSDAPPALPALEQYVDAGAAQFATADAADDWATLQLLAHDMNQAILAGRGAVRRLVPGFGFDLSGHDAFGEASNGNNGAFTVLSVQHDAVNNLGTGFKHATSFNHTVPLKDAEDGTYRNRFTAIPAETAIMPDAASRIPTTTARGPQTALVVGLADAVTTSTRNHQVRIQFHWQRGAAPNPGGLRDTGGAAMSGTDSGHAPGNEQSGTWVRVAESIAGANYGASFTPRIGTEVVVDFMHGDMDQPVVVASLYNGVDTPPFAAGVDGGLDHAGVVSGWHSRNFGGDGFNQWLVDDAASELQMQLASSSAMSALNLGWLRARSPASALRGTARGLGLEARTDAWGQLRGAEGVWLTTAKRVQMGTSVQSTQLDVSEAAEQLRSAEALNQGLRDAATAQSALTSDIALQSFGTLIKKLQPSADSAAAKALRFDAPLLGLDSAANLNTATAGSVLCFAQQHIGWTTMGDSHWCAQHTVSINSGEATSWFAHDGGLSVVAAHAPVSLAAHTDALELLSAQAMTVTSTDEAIVIEAQQRITLQAGQASITLDGANITLACPGVFEVKGTVHPFGQGGRDAAVLAKLPDTTSKWVNDERYNYRAKFKIRDKEAKQLLAEKAYRTERNGVVTFGQTNLLGETHIEESMQPENVKVVLDRNEKVHADKLTELEIDDWFNGEPS